jgi:pantoate--beta-alanine ligase
MLIIKDQIEYQNIVKSVLYSDNVVGFVPTMGALHIGHISLIEAAKSKCHVVVCSIFVNPTQFNNAQDFAKYPITIEKDIELLTEAGCDILFLPEIDCMYPEGIEKAKEIIYDLNGLDTHLEGAFRPGHFQGVAMVVHRLLNIVQPHHLFMGIKDYQQCMVVQALIENKAIPTKLHICPTLREKNGLAMSSRNARLSTKGREKAGIINKCLLKIKNAIGNTTFNLVKDECDQLLVKAGLTPEYTILAHATTLEILDDYNDGAMVVLIAAFLEDVRLIDNMVIK